MSPVHSVLAPTSSLPPLRNPDPERVNEDTITSALRNLTDIYCPLPRAAAFNKPSLGIATPVPVDSGYASGEEEDEKEEEDKQGQQDQHGCDIADTDAIANLRSDTFEREFAVRWLTTFVARAEELLCDADDDTRQRLIDDASYILASFSNASDADEDEEAGAMVRDFQFWLKPQKEGEEEHEDESASIKVRLTDGTPAVGSDHTDVGLQSWGASIVVSELLCSGPQRFDLSVDALGAAPRIIELGAGTGLVGITMAKLLPRLGMAGAEVIATDYHPAVLANLRDNIAMNFPPSSSSDASDEDKEYPVQTCLLDWSVPRLEAPLLDRPADMLIATDVVYAPQHATWLRDCAARLLAPHGVFWLVASVRPNGRFEGVTDTVESAFADSELCPRSDDGRRVFRILDKVGIEKRKGIGRADEVGYRMFRIGWVEVEAAAMNEEEETSSS
ncbi:hypothetical protein M406DRAFT_293032 [Cryphonectria parasitica EP155]|uniref:Uncharacterized protein n=1 Tax=Cryphonectria parasitica (strain ATCC 38755 / EP155) TaxID=660469 RepID=A0A9P4XYS2_CRYP1|nr:uncharacterized protein M406DRAFT_293032 [Cryphonectria parasitica EP155]KAF3763379.1 hypothetical protein M406DRAFT_293032 [Cryphonectria parasitica EP155]